MMPVTRTRLCWPIESRLPYPFAVHASLWFAENDPRATVGRNPIHFGELEVVSTHDSRTRLNSSVQRLNSAGQSQAIVTMLHVSNCNPRDCTAFGLHTGESEPSQPGSHSFAVNNPRETPNPKVARQIGPRSPGKGETLGKYNPSNSVYRSFHFP